ncbi:hypothetical protein DPMN_025784 [Dreissena polymorpha]|uniref:Uncharacterized protein n=1 Tax=Dreissena polymorpha TaxID=45954 RepID=A0A9D4LS01_DREPO|nr:hypothetical protein DPMN_025784 [Dreissena polymorpha]
MVSQLSMGQSEPGLCLQTRQRAHTRSESSPLTMDWCQEQQQLCCMSQSLGICKTQSLILPPFRGPQLSQKTKLWDQLL